MLALRYTQPMLMLVLLAVTTTAQEPRFRTRAREVVVPVAVTTTNGKPVENLTADDFIVLNDGKPQRAKMLPEDAFPLPIYAALVLQANDGSQAALAKIKKTAAVVSSYITNDLETGRRSMAAVLTVSDEVRTVQDFTSDADALDDAFAKLKATGSSGRLLDGVATACDLLATHEEPARRMIVLIGESRDRGSNAKFADVVRRTQRNNVAIYTLSYSAYATAFTQKAAENPPPDQPGSYDPAANGGGIPLLAIAFELARLAKVNVAEALAQATGGSHAKFTTLHGVEEQLSAIGTEIHNRYTLTFIPPDEPPGFHRLSVSFRTPTEAHVHARTAYWTEPESK